MNPEPHPPRFEDVYPRCEFAPLVHVTLGLAERMMSFLNKRTRALQTAVPHGLPSGRN